MVTVLIFSIFVFLQKSFEAADKKLLILEQAVQGSEMQRLQQLQYIGVVQRSLIARLPPIGIHADTGVLAVQQRFGSADTAARAAHALKEVRLTMALHQIIDHAAAFRHTVRLLGIQPDFAVRVQTLKRPGNRLAHPAIARVDTAEAGGIFPRDIRLLREIDLQHVKNLPGFLERKHIVDNAGHIFFPGLRLFGDTGAHKYRECFRM